MFLWIQDHLKIPPTQNQTRKNKFHAGNAENFSFQKGEGHMKNAADSKLSLSVQWLPPAPTPPLQLTVRCLPLTARQSDPGQSSPASPQQGHVNSVARHSTVKACPDTRSRAHHVQQIGRHNPSKAGKAHQAVKIQSSFNSALYVEKQP